MSYFANKACSSYLPNMMLIVFRVQCVVENSYRPTRYYHTGNVKEYYNTDLRPHVVLAADVLASWSFSSTPAHRNADSSHCYRSHYNCSRRSVKRMSDDR